MTSSGILKTNREKYSFEFDGGYLQVSKLYKNKPDDWNLDPDVAGKVLIGRNFPTDNTIVFYRAKKFHKPILKNEHYAIDYAVYYKNNRQKIDALSLEIDELDNIYNKSHSIISIKNLFNENADGKFDIKTKDFKNTDSKDYYIKIRGEKLRVKIETSRTVSFHNSTPLKTKIILKLYGNFGYRYDFIYDALLNVKKLFAFISYRQNIDIKEIITYRETTNGNLTPNGNIKYSGHDNSILSYMRMDHDEKDYIDFRYIDNQFGDLFQSIIDDEAIMKFIPDNHRDDKLIIPYNVVMTTAVFEYEFNQAKFIIEHSKKKQKQKKIILKVLENAKNNKDKWGINSDGIKEIKRLSTLIETDTLALKFKTILEKYSDILEPTGKIMCNYCEIEYDLDKISDSTAKLRNDIAHDTDNKIFNPDDCAKCGIALMVRAIYAIKLKESGMDNKKITLFLQDLFK